MSRFISTFAFAGLMGLTVPTYAQLSINPYPLDTQDVQTAPHSEAFTDTNITVSSSIPDVEADTLTQDAQSRFDRPIKVTIPPLSEHVQTPSRSALPDKAPQSRPLIVSTERIDLGLGTRPSRANRKPSMVFGNVDSFASQDTQPLYKDAELDSPSNQAADNNSDVERPPLLAPSPQTIQRNVGIEESVAPLNLTEQIALAKNTTSQPFPAQDTIVLNAPSEYINDDIVVSTVVNDMEDTLATEESAMPSDEAYQTPQETVIFDEVDVLATNDDLYPVINEDNISIEPIQVEKESFAFDDNLIVATDVPQSIESQPYQETEENNAQPSTPTTWQAFRGARLQDVLGTWAAAGNKVLIWDAVENFKVQENTTISGSFEDAVSALLQQYSAEYTRPVGNLHTSPTGQSTLVVLSHRGA